MLGLALVAAPNALLALFGIPATTEVWVRVVGMLVVILGLAPPVLVLFGVVDSAAAIWTWRALRG